MNMEKVAFTASVVPCSAQMITIDSEKCCGCNRCVEVCQCDVLLPSQQKGGAPVAAYPGECCCCGACVMACPQKGAIHFRHPLMNQARFVACIRPEEL